MEVQPPPRRAFLFLQGLATPFFARLGQALAESGHLVRKVNFNGGDRLFWPLPGGIDFRGRAEEWPREVERLLLEHRITDLVLFADCRPLHRVAIAAAKARGVAIHVFEEGYLRPGWITLERNGTNGFSELPRDPALYLQEGLAMPPLPLPTEMGASFYRRASEDVNYNIANLTQRWRFPHWETHRGMNVWHEYLGWLTRAARRPVTGWKSRRRIEALLRGKAPFYVFPLQLESDFQIRVHSPFDTVEAAIRDVLASFAAHAPAGSRIAIKGHPLDNGLIGWGKIVAQLAARFGVQDRVDWIPEAPFGPLLMAAEGVVTINSTAGAQAIWSGKPTVALGRAIYALPGMTFQHGLDRFWAEAEAPDFGLVEAFRRVVAARCLIRGSFFSEEGIELGVRDAAARLLGAAPRLPGATIAPGSPAEVPEGDMAGPDGFPLGTAKLSAPVAMTFTPRRSSPDGGTPSGAPPEARVVAWPLRSAASPAFYPPVGLSRSDVPGQPPSRLDAS